MLSGESLTLERAAAHHLQTVLRVKPDTCVTLFDGAGQTRQVRVTDVTRHGITLVAETPLQRHPRSGCELTLFACVSKGKRMDWTVEKAVELGVARLVPVLSERTVVRLDPEEGDARVERWQRVAEEAARQCGAVWLPEIVPPCDFREALTRVLHTQPLFVAALTPGTRLLRDALAGYATSPQQAGWFVGPEGDFTPDELSALIAAGAIPVSLGPLVLRTETACLYGLCALHCAWS